MRKIPLGFLIISGLLSFAHAQPPVKSAAGFTHPGILHSREDLDRIGEKVKAGEQPWARGFEALKATPQSSLDYVMQGPFKKVGYENGQYEFRRDASAAYNLALMWICTGNAPYAEKSLGLIRAWAREMESFDKGDHLTGGMGVHKFAAAAEIFRYTRNSGWTTDDTAGFVKFLDRMKPSLDKPNLFMNQGGYAVMGMTAIAVFSDDAGFYQKTIHRATEGEHQDPRKDSALSKTIWPSGQVVEMGRDQTHPQGGLGSLACIAQTAWIQGGEITGKDLFEAYDQRLLKGFESMAAHNLGYDVEFKAVDEKGNPGLYQKLSPVDRGKLSPVFEMVYQHYKYIRKVAPEAIRYCGEVREYLGTEGFSEDFPGFGTLTFSRPEALEAKPTVETSPVKAAPKDGLATGRFPAANYSSTQGVGREYFTDLKGRTEMVASNIQADDHVIYENFDFGSQSVDTFIARAGSASPAGCKIDVFLDSLESEPITILQVANTGWWSTFETFSSKLKQPVSGRHKLILRFHGGNHVYKFQCNLHWFRFGNDGVWEAEKKAAASDAGFPFMEAERYGAVLAGKATRVEKAGDRSHAEVRNGTVLSFPQVEFSSGPSAISLTLSASQPGTIELREGDLQQAPLAVIDYPGTDGKWQTFPVPVDGKPPLKGSRILFVTFKAKTGDEPIRFAGFQLNLP